MKSILKQLFIGLTMFGTLVGAGFASGKEIWYYFAQWGNISYIMIILTSIIFFLCSFLFFSFGKKYQINTVQQCNKIILGKFALVGEIIIVFSNLLLLASMFAGADSLFNIILPNLPYRLASVSTSILTFAVVCFGFKSITKTNTLIVPLLLCVVAVVLISSLIIGNSPISATHQTLSSAFGSIIYALLFVGSNMFFSGFIFARLGKDFSKKELLGGSAFGAFFLMVSLLGITMALFANPTAIYSDMPIVAIASSLNNVFAYCVLIIIWLGLITTAFALLYTISNWLKTYFGKPIFVTFLATFCALLLSGIGFSIFVRFIYPTMGVFGFIYMTLVLRTMQKQKCNNYNNKNNSNKANISCIRK